MHGAVECGVETRQLGQSGVTLTAADRSGAVDALGGWIEDDGGRDALAAAGHRCMPPELPRAAASHRGNGQGTAPAQPPEPEHLPLKIKLSRCIPSVIPEGRSCLGTALFVCSSVPLGANQPWERLGDTARWRKAWERSWHVLLRREKKSGPDAERRSLP